MVSKKNKIKQLFSEGIENNVVMGASAGLGVFMGIIPIWGFQMIVAVGVAHVLRLNKPIVLLFSNISIPLMIPLILFLSIQIGSIILHQKWLTISLEKIDLQFCMELIWPYLFGSTILAITAGLLCFFAVWALLYILRGNNMSIEHYLPHRDPIRLVDKLLFHDNTKTICEVNWEQKPFFHECARTAMIEMIAQTSAVMLAKEQLKSKSKGLGMLTAVKNFTFYDYPSPQDKITVEVQTEGALGQHKIVNGEVKQKQKLIASGRVFLYLEMALPSENH